MTRESNVWALVLAAGDGTRLRSLTTVSAGATVPKQFCSLHEGPSLLQEALCRAQTVTPRSQTCAVVAERHRRWWEEALSALPEHNVIVQPENRGTAIGVLLPLVHIMSRDPDARVILLPSDHYVGQEAVMTAALREALQRLEGRYHEAMLLGIVPDEPDPDLGYILPGACDGHGTCTVQRFVEKPSSAEARALIEAGGLWNAFIVAATAGALLELFLTRIPEIVNALNATVLAEREGHLPEGALAALYAKLPTLDFSRDIVAGQESALRTLRVPVCGWSDLGTPKRVAEALRRYPQSRTAPWMRAGQGCLSLARQHQALQHTQGIAIAV